MNQRSILQSAIASIGILMFVSQLHAEDTRIVSKIESVGLFKNGMALVDRTVELTGAGTYLIDDMPTPVHGTFFIESATPVIARTTMALVDAPLDPTGSLQDQLAGKGVTVVIKDKAAPIEGKVAVIEDPSKTPAPVNPYGYPVPQQTRYLVIDTLQGQTMIDPSTITSINITGNAPAKVRKPVLILNLPAAAGDKQIVHITYLTYGLAWAPSYRVELLDEKKLAITQNAVIKNELADLKEVEMFLISGFSSVGFGQVTSPLALTQNWQAFFAQLSQRPGGTRFDNGGVMQQQMVTSNSAIGGAVMAGGGDQIPSSDDSVDVHYETIDKQTLLKGDALSLDVAAAQADFERIVEWTIPDTRDSNGRYMQDYQRQQNPELFDDSPWDAVKFKNPLPFAMTTAPATFMKEGKFLGQQISKWVNKEEENSLRITKALSIRTHASENEEPNADRQVVYVGGNDFRKVKVNGELSIKNYRKTDSKIIIKRQFSGDMLSADDKPETKLREEGVWSVNRRNEIIWTITLKAGEEKTIKYAYSVLVDN